MQQRYLCLIHWRFPHTSPSKGGWTRTPEAAKRKEQHQSSPQPQLSALEALASSENGAAVQASARSSSFPEAAQRSGQLTKGQRGLGLHPSGRRGTHSSGPLPRLPTPAEPTNLRKSDDHYQQWQSLHPRGVQTRGKSPGSGSSKAPMAPRPREQ